MPKTGIEPVWFIQPQDFKSCASANSATSALNWRRHPDSDWGYRCCRPLPYHLAMPPQRKVKKWSERRDLNPRPSPWQGDALPLSHFRSIRWCLGPESNQRHMDFQSIALPAELPRQMATWTGLEPVTSSVTGWHSNQLNYQAAFLSNGGRYRARTYDPLLVRQVLSQLS